MMKNYVEAWNLGGCSNIILVCEHASKFVPEEYENLGLTGDCSHILTSHVGWDLGAYQLARVMSRELDATLVSSGVSRLLYDCNRDPNAVDAIVERCEFGDIPGNIGLSDDERKERVARFYTPFRDTLSSVMREKDKKILVTIHSFTPVSRGESRDVEIGVLHHDDGHLADRLFTSKPEGFDIRRNEPYGREVTHTLQEHGKGIWNVMIEIRNDLIREQGSMMRMGKMCSDWLLNGCKLELSD